MIAIQSKISFAIWNRQYLWNSLAQRSEPFIDLYILFHIISIFPWFRFVFVFFLVFFLHFSFDYRIWMIQVAKVGLFTVVNFLLILCDVSLLFIFISSILFSLCCTQLDRICFGFDFKNKFGDCKWIYNFQNLFISKLDHHKKILSFRQINIANKFQSKIPRKWVGMGSLAISAGHVNDFKSDWSFTFLIAFENFFKPGFFAYSYHFDAHCS